MCLCSAQAAPAVTIEFDIPSNQILPYSEDGFDFVELTTFDFVTFIIGGADGHLDIDPDTMFPEPAIRISSSGPFSLLSLDVESITTTEGIFRMVTCMIDSFL